MELTRGQKGVSMGCAGPREANAFSEKEWETQGHMHISHVGIIGAVYAHMSSFRNFRKVHESRKQVRFPENAFAPSVCAEPEASAFSGKRICFRAGLVKNTRFSNKCVLG